MNRAVTVLQVEDDQVDVLNLKRVFRELEITNPVRVARDGLEALKVLRGGEGEPPLRRPFLVLLDLNLPRMNGIELLEAIRSDPELKDSLVFVMTTSRTDRDKIQGVRIQRRGLPRQGRPQTQLARIGDHARALLEGRRVPLGGARSILRVTQPLALLLVEDDEVDRMAVVRALRRSELGATVESAPDGARAFAMLESGAFDAILLDYRLPDTDGLTFLRGLREQVDPPPAVIVLTGQGNEELALEMMEAGAHDYLVKDEVSSSVLQRSLRYALARRQFVQMEERARACQLRELSELSSKKDRFLSNVSHELRSPLSSISNFVEAILRDPSERLAAEHRQYLEIARSSVRRLRGMIEDLVETARVNSVGLSIEPRKMEVGAAMRRAVEALMPKAAAKGLRLEAAIPERPRSVLADPKRVVQMLINLIENAIKFTPEGGRIVVRARVFAGAGHGAARGRRLGLRHSRGGLCARVRAPPPGQGRRQ